MTMYFTLWWWSTIRDVLDTADWMTNKWKWGYVLDSPSSWRAFSKTLIIIRVRWIVRNFLIVRDIMTLPGLAQLLTINYTINIITYSCISMNCKLISHVHKAFQTGHNMTLNFQIYYKRNVTFIGISYILCFVSGKARTWEAVVMLEHDSLLILAIPYVLVS